MSIEAVSAALQPAYTALPGMTGRPQTIDVANFEAALSAVGASPGAAGGLRPVPAEVSPAMKAMFTQLEKVNGEAKSVSDFATTAKAAGASMTPSEIVQLTVRCQEFMFHCQLTSNIANRTSDGVQQLFRQQS